MASANGSVHGRKAVRSSLSMLLVALLMVSAGCDPISGLSFLLMPWMDDNIPPQVQIAAPKKEVKVVILASFASPDTPLELQTVDRELCDRLAAHMKKRYDANKEKVKIVPNYKVRNYLNKDTNTALLSKREIGKHFKADYVINLEINSMTFYETGSRQLFRGKADIAVSVFDMKQPSDEGPIFEKVHNVPFPTTGPMDAGGSSVAQFRGLFIDRLGQDLSRYFAAYPHDERYDFDRMTPGGFSL